MVYVSPEDFHNSLEKPVTGYFSIFYLNIPSINKNFGSFKTFLSSLDFTLGIICFSETWCDELDNFIYDLPDYISTHQKRSDRKGVSTYIHNSHNLKLDLIFLLTAEILNHLHWELYLRKHATL